MTYVWKRRTQRQTQQSVRSQLHTIINEVSNTELCRVNGITFLVKFQRSAERAIGIALHSIVGFRVSIWSQLIDRPESIRRTIANLYIGFNSIEPLLDRSTAQQINPITARTHTRCHTANFQYNSLCRVLYPCLAVHHPWADRAIPPRACGVRSEPCWTITVEYKNWFRSHKIVTVLMDGRINYTAGAPILCRIIVNNTRPESRSNRIK